MPTAAARTGRGGAFGRSSCRSWPASWTWRSAFAICPRRWNKIEPRPFSFISQNWRAKPLTDLAAIVGLTSATTTSTGLKVYGDLDTNSSPKGIAVSDAQIKALNIQRAEFHGERNYTLIS